MTFDHEADFMIVVRLIPPKAAAEVTADLQLCAVYLPESIPDKHSISLIHRAIVPGAAPWWGFAWVMKNASSPAMVFLSAR